MIKVLVLFSVLFGAYSHAELAIGTEVPGSVGIQRRVAPRVEGLSRAEQEEARWREENDCPEAPADVDPAALKCAKGVIASLGALVTAPYALFRADEQCYNDLDYKKGLMSVVAPLLTGDGRVSHNFSNWPEGSSTLLESSPVYQSYMRLSCSEVMSMVHNRERRALAAIHNKRIKQRDYDNYLGRAPNDSRRIAQAERRYPEEVRTLTPEEQAFERLYNTRKALLDQQGSNERVLGRIGDKALCLWKNTTIADICGLATDVAVAIGTVGLGLAGTSAKAAARAARRDLAGDVRAGTLRRNGILNDADRISAAESRLGRGLTSVEKDALIEAHNVGANRVGAGIGNYTQAEIAQKARILRNAGLSPADTRRLMEDGIAGSMVSPDVMLVGGRRVSTPPLVNKGENLTLGNLATQLGRNDHRIQRGSGGNYDPRWFEKPEVRSDVAGEVRTHLDAGGRIDNVIQRESLRRVLAAEAYDNVGRTGRGIDYDVLSSRYTQMGYPPGWPLVDSDYITRLSGGIRPEASSFQLQSRLMDSRMAIAQMQSRIGDLNNPIQRMGMGIEERAALREVRSLRQTIQEIENKVGIAESMLSGR